MQWIIHHTLLDYQGHGWKGPVVDRDDQSCNERLLFHQIPLIVLFTHILTLHVQYISVLPLPYLDHMSMPIVLCQVHWQYPVAE